VGPSQGAASLSELVAHGISEPVARGMSEPVARGMSEPVARGIGQLNQAAIHAVDSSTLTISTSGPNNAPAMLILGRGGASPLGASRAGLGFSSATLPAICPLPGGSAGPLGASCAGLGSASLPAVCP